MNGQTAREREKKGRAGKPIQTLEAGKLLENYSSPARKKKDHDEQQTRSSTFLIDHGNEC